MKKLFEEFKEFAMKGSMIDLAVGIIIGGAFTAIVGSLVSDIINPIIGIFSKKDFSQLFVALDGQEYASVAAAEEAGGNILKYGSFISAIINFVIIAIVIFCMVKVINTARAKAEAKKAAEAAAEEPTTKVCPFCQSEIAIAATRCPQCTSLLAEEVDMAAE